MDILDRFIEQAEKNVKEGYYELSTEPQKNHGTEKKAFVNRKVSLKQKISENYFSLIAEIKHASPAGEYSFDFIDAKKTAKDFETAGADAVSVVVEPKIFLGKLSNVHDVKTSCSLPVLFKDFIISKKQVNASAGVGADCVLLVVKIFDRLGLDVDEFIDYAHSLGLEVLLECYDENEMEKAIDTKADFFGVNNRDLRTLKVDLNVTRKVLENFNGTDDRPVISESGIFTKADAQYVKACGAKGVLVGTALWKSRNYFDTIKDLTSKVRI